MADVDGESVTYANVGVEGIISLSPNTSIEMRGGIGLSTARDLDYIFVGARLSTALGNGATTLYADYTIAEFDEVDISALGQELTIGIDTRMTGRIGAFSALTKSHLAGTSLAAETTIRAGLTITFGRFGGNNPISQALHTADPVAQLVRRGLF